MKKKKVGEKTKEIRKSIRSNHFRYMYSHSSFCNVRFTYTINRINKVVVSSSELLLLLLLFRNKYLHALTQIHTIQ